MTNWNPATLWLDPWNSQELLVVSVSVRLVTSMLKDPYNVSAP
jgi:hypothetical protein